MPQSVLDGRIIKRGQTSRTHAHASNQLVAKYKAERNGRAKANDILDKYREVVKYYYLTRRYTDAQLYEAMELIFNVGASPKQYTGYVNKCGFGKRLKKEEWKSIAGYCYAYRALGQELSIKIGGCYKIEPGTVKKELSRQISPTEEMQILRQGVPIPEISGWPLTVGRCELYDSLTDATFERIPDRIMCRLPIWKTRNALLEICMRKPQGRNITGQEIAKSDYFGFLKVLLYRLSNDLIDYDMLDELLDKVILMGFRPLLKELLSLRTLSVRTAAENILPLLVLRCDEDLIDCIFSIHGNLPVDYYDVISWLRHLNLELDPIPDVYEEEGGWFRITPQMVERYDGTGKVSQFLANYLESRQILPSTLWDAAILVACAVMWGFMSITTVKKMLPSRIDLGEVEEWYEGVFRLCVLNSESSIPLRDLLDYGFRRDLHLTTLLAVLFDDSDKFFDLVSFTEIGVHSAMCRQLKLLKGDGDRELWEILGVEGFSRLVLATVEELGETEQEQWFFGYSLCVAAEYIDLQCFEFVLECLRTKFPREELVAFLAEVWGMLVETAGRGLLLEWLLPRHDATGFKLWTILGASHPEYWGELARHTEEELFQLCRMLVDFGIDVNGSFEFEGVSISTSLNYAIISGKVELVKALLRLRADPNLEDQEGRTPSMMLLCWLTRKWDHKKSLPKKEKFRKIFNEILRAGAVITPANLTSQKAIDTVHSFGDCDWPMPYLQPELITAFCTGDVDQLYQLWSDMCSHPKKPKRSCDICDGAIASFDSLFGKHGWAHLAGLLRQHEQHEQHEQPENRGKNCPLRIYYDSIYQDLTPCLYTEGGKVPGTLDCLLALGDEAEPLEKFILSHPAQAKAEISGRPQNKCLSPLQLAAKKERTKCLLILLQNGSDPREEIYKGKYTGLSALHHAVEGGHLDMARHLLEYGADIYMLSKPDGWDSYGSHDRRTAVEFAVELRRLDFIQLFLLHDIECRGMALAAAEEYGHKSIANWIKEEWMGKLSDSTSQPSHHSICEVEE
ncbi:hypothetical protein TWF481_007388 [Arthrobotrys musiformis]|uniref:Clr5 domain-containing protein n=1 Tax=Arthrobotrys musiformis TaxID=47236 RepID=A0AAV9WD97_9PEZI